MRRRGHIWLFLMALAAAPACADDIHLGTEPPIWSADHETGDLSQWTAGGDTAGVEITNGGGSLAVVGSPTHGGRFAARASVNAASGLAFARLTRLAVPQDAYFSAWFYLPRTYTIGEYWNVFELQGRTDPADDSTYTTLWSIDLRQGDDGAMVWYVYDSLRGTERKAELSLSAPVGRWFRIQAFVHQATDASGRLVIWIDGHRFVEVSGVSTVPAPWMAWAVGSAASKISEQPADLYIDDATIVVPRP